MANKMPTVRTYPLNGAVDFTITFEYLARKFVQVSLIGKRRKELVLNQDYRFTTKTQITTSRAWTADDDYQMIEIRRFTSATDRLVDFADGSILRAYDLNIAQIQTLHVAEEARDLTADNIGVNNDGHLDARGRRIVNVADPVEDGDAVNLYTFKSFNNSAFNSMNAAKVSENNAKVSENNAKASETRSVQAETRSVTAETNSKNSETMAQKWAANPLDEIVANNMFSSFHYANQANLSAGAAKTSENNSASSASASAASAVTSKNEADRAKTEADKLGNMNAFAGTLKSVDTETNSVTWKGDGTFEGHMTIGGQLSSSTGWSITSDGNLYIKKYDSFIDEWADGRYIRKNAGWTEVWEGGAVIGQTVALSQDVRWRTIWIQTNGKWNPIEIGGDGPYYISSHGGWLAFTISNNGRSFRNDDDHTSVPTSIHVRND